MKILQLITTSLLLVTTASAQVKTDLQKENLRSGVKQVTVSAYEAIDDNGYVGQGDINYQYITYYNQQGNKQKETHMPTRYNSGGDDKFIYDSNNNLIEEDDYSADGSIYNKLTYKYDAKGNRIEEVKWQREGNLEFKTLFTYDSKGNQIKADFYLPNGSLQYSTTFKYDIAGNMIEGANINPDGSTVISYSYEYDEKGNEIENKNYNSRGELTSEGSTRYQYNADGNWVKQVSSYQVITREIQ